MPPIRDVMKGFVKALKEKKRKKIGQIGQKGSKTQTNPSAQVPLSSQNKPVTPSLEVIKIKPLTTKIYVDNLNNTIVRMQVPELEIKTIEEVIKKALADDIKKIFLFHNLNSPARLQYDESNNAFWDIQIHTQDIERQQVLIEMLSKKNELFYLSTTSVDQIKQMPKLYFERRGNSSVTVSSPVPLEEEKKIKSNEVAGINKNNSEDSKAQTNLDSSKNSANNKKHHAVHEEPKNKKEAAKPENKNIPNKETAAVKSNAQPDKDQTLNKNEVKSQVSSETIIAAHNAEVAQPEEVKALDPQEENVKQKEVKQAKAELLKPQIAEDKVQAEKVIETKAELPPDEIIKPESNEAHLQETPAQPEKLAAAVLQEENVKDSEKKADPATVKEVENSPATSDIEKVKELPIEAVKAAEISAETVATEKHESEVNKSVDEAEKLKLKEEHFQKPKPETIEIKESGVETAVVSEKVEAAKVEEVKLEEAQAVVKVEKLSNPEINSALKPMQAESSQSGATESKNLAATALQADVVKTTETKSEAVKFEESQAVEIKNETALVEKVELETSEVIGTAAEVKNEAVAGIEESKPQEVQKTEDKVEVSQVVELKSDLTQAEVAEPEIIKIDKEVAVSDIRAHEVTAEKSVVLEETNKTEVKAEESKIEQVKTEALSESNSSEAVKTGNNSQKTAEETQQQEGKMTATELQIEVKPAEEAKAEEAKAEEAKAEEAKAEEAKAEEAKAEEAKAEEAKAEEAKAEEAAPVQPKLSSAEKAKKEREERELMLHQRYQEHAERIRKLFPDGAVKITIKDKEEEIQLSFGNNAKLCEIVRRNLEDYQKIGKNEIGNNFTIPRNNKVVEMFNDDRQEIWREAFKKGVSTQGEERKTPIVIIKKKAAKSLQQPNNGNTTNNA
jgi:hypothetical protein